MHRRFEGFSSIRKLKDRLSLSRETPHQIAFGFAAGILIGMTPWFGLHIVSVLLVASLMGWSKLSAIAGVNITNPITAPVVYALNFWIGSQLTGRQPLDFPLNAFNLESAMKMLRSTPDIFWNLLVGGVVLGIPMSVAGYFLIHYIITKSRRKSVRRPSMAI